MTTSKPFLFLTAVLAALVLTGLWLAAPGVALAVPSASIPAEESAPRGAVDEAFLALVRRLDAPSSRGPQAAAADFTLHLDLSEYLVAGHVPSPAPVFITVTQASGTARSFTVYPVPDGGTFLYLAALKSFWYWDFPYPGDLITLRQGSQVLSMTVPELSAYLSAPRDILTGTAPAGESLTAYLFPFDDPAAWYTATAAASASGAYTLTWAAFPDVRPRDGGYLFLRRGSTSLSRRFIAPFLLVQSGGYYLGGQLLPYGSGALMLPSGYGLDFWADGEGYFSQDLSRHIERTYLPAFDAGRAITVSVGGKIVTTTVRHITARFDQARNLLLGEASPGASVRIRVFTGPLQAGNTLWPDDVSMESTLTADASGQYSLPLSLASGNYGLALVENGDGHQSFDWFAVPRFTFHLGWHEAVPYTVIEGQVDSLEPLTVSLYGPSGYPKAQYVIQPHSNGVLYSFPWEIFSRSGIALALESGDGVRLAQHGVDIFSATLPLLTLELDPAGEFVYGQAPAGERITVSGDDGWGSEARSVVVTASLTGTYRLPLDAVTPAASFYRVSALWDTPQGYSVERSFSSWRSCPPRPAEISVGGSRVVWWKFTSSPQCGGMLEARLRGADGTLKAEDSLSLAAREVNFHTAAGHPVSIEGGDVVEIEAQGQVVQVAVPPLEVHLDAGNGRILGHGVAGEPVSLSYRRGDTFWSAEVTASLSGAFTLTLPGNVPILPGTEVQALLLHHRTNFVARDVLPWWQVSLSEQTVRGVLLPLTPYTLTHRSLEAGSVESPSSFADETGAWKVSLSASLGAGDRLTLTTPSAVYTLTVPALSAAFDLRTGTVSGIAPPEGDLLLQFLDVWPWGERVVLAEARPAHGDGHYTATLPSRVRMAGVQGELYYAPSASGEIMLGFLPPHWEVTLGSAHVNGVAPVRGREALFTWESLAGKTFTTTLRPRAADGEFFVYLPEGGMQPGDVLSLEFPHQTATYTVPQVTAEHDYARQVLSGEAPAGARLEAGFPVANGGYLSRQVYVDSQGFYGVDTSDLPLTPKSGGYVLLTDAWGNTVRCYFTVTGYRAWLPVIER